MAILRPTWQDIITEHSVETWQDWPWDTWLGPYAVISPRRYRVRVRVYRAGEWIDITSRVASGTIRESNDQPVATLDLRLLEGGRIAPGPTTVSSLTTMRAEHEVPVLPMRDAGPLPSIAPRRKDSPLNQVNGQYVPLLWIGRLIAVEAAFSEDGSEPDEWWPVFVGELGDDIDTVVEKGQVYVQVFCRDLAARLQRAYIAGPWTFENMYASEMIQAISDRAYTEGLIQEPVTVHLVGPDDFWVERYDIEYTDLWSALQRFCQQRGTDLRYRLSETTGQIELTYWLPDRAMVPNWIIDGAQIRREELRISGTDIINKVTVRYRDVQTDQRAEAVVQDEDSIAMYGLRHGLIEEPDTDLIPDAATAQALAQAIVEDLKDVPALTRLTLPFDPRIQLFDKLRVVNPAVRDEAEDYAIEGRELQFSATDWSMVLIGGGRVVVKRQTWLERMATEGVKRPFTPRDTTTSVIPPAPTIVEAKSVPGGVQLTLAPPLGLYWNGFVIHASKTPSFTPGPETEVAWGSETRFSILGLDPGETYYFKAQSVDFARNRSAASNEVNAKAGALTPDGFTAVVGNALVTTDGGGAERVVVGDLSGRIWRGQPLPSGTYGQLLNNGYLLVTTPDGHVITIDPEGIEMTPAGWPQRGMHLNGRMQGFWDINDIPGIGIGDVREMAQELGSDMEFGLLLNLGEVRASQAVLEQSLVDSAITTDKIADGAVTGPSMADGAVSVAKINTYVQIPDASKLTVLRYENTTPGSLVGIGSSFTTIDSWTVTKRDNNNGLLMEVAKIEFTVQHGSSPENLTGQQVRVLVDGNPIFTATGPTNLSSIDYSVVVDFRSLSDGSHTITIQGRTDTTGFPGYRVSNRRVYQNEQLPIRWGMPIYTISGHTAGGCYTTCEVTCEGQCEAACQSGCETTCEADCQKSCMATCQITSQGGGGCLREGTPVTVWDQEAQQYIEVPVEQLTPGMILPAYNPENDTVEHGQLLELRDAGFSNRFIRIHTDVGPSVDVTYSQPFDVLIDTNDGPRWVKMNARFLKPGMKMVRPFDVPEKRIATITQVEEVREYKVRFWDPKVSHGRYTAAGYADQHMKQ